MGQCQIYHRVRHGGDGFQIGCTSEASARDIRVHYSKPTRSTYISIPRVFSLLNQPLLTAEQPGVASRSPKEPTAPKRQYRRHPRPDLNAPIRPKSAYVLFGEQVRQDPTLSAFSFTDLAKETGKRWKEISDDEKERAWNASAATKLLDYKSKLEAYKRTKDYRRYQEYLDDFKQVQNDSDERRTLSSTPDPKHTIELPPQRDTPMQLSEQPPSNSPETDSQDTAQDTQDMHVDNERDEALDLQFEEASGSVKAGLEEVHRISKSLGINSHLVRVAPFPEEAATAKSVETFLRCTGALVYLWSHEQGSRQVQSLYHSPSDLTPINSVEVFAMAAVGSYCDGHPDTRALANDFLEYFVYMLSSPLRFGALPSMRLYTCLAICRFTNSVESARKLMRKWCMPN